MKSRKQSLKEYAVILSGTDTNGIQDVETLFVEARTKSSAREMALNNTEMTDVTVLDCVGMGAVATDDAFTMEFFSIGMDDDSAE